MEAPSPSRRRPKRPADDHYSLSESPSSQWIRSIQNESFQPKPTAYSPQSLEDEDPLMLQLRQCKDKLRALQYVRERIKFYPLRPLDKRRHGEDAYSMKISTSMILSGEDDSLGWQEEQSDGQLKSERHNVGIDALGGMEMLLFGYFSPQELLRVSTVCRAWKTLARDDLFWEPLLVTPLEKYPLRPLLGMERNPTCQQEDVPAILVYMVYQRLKLAQAAFTKDGNGGNSNVSTRMNAGINRRYNTRFMELFNRQQARIAQVQAEPVSSVHLVCGKANPALRTQEDDEMARIATELQLQALAGGQAVPLVGVPTVAAVVPGPQQPVVNVQNRAGVADDEDVFSVADGRNRVTLSAWLHTRQCVSERTLRSFLRQMLLAVDALERSNCEHGDISLVNIVVHNQPSAHRKSAQSGANVQSQEERGELAEDDVDMVEAPELDDHPHQRIPLFQLFLSRRNCQHSGGARDQALEPVLPVDGDVNEPAVIVDLDGEIAHQRQRLAAAEAEAAAGGGNPGNGGLRGIMAGAFRHRLAFPHPTMVSSVIQTAVMVWAHGRFVNADASNALALLLRFPDSFSGGLRSILEYAKYLIITHSASASKLLRHEYLRCSEAELARHPSVHWSTMPINDVNEYKSKLVAYYGSLPSRVDGLLDDNSSTSVSAQVLEELMPTTILGNDYFSRALEEVHIASDRFVSVVAPSTASSAWVRKLASTQTYTLQRLDLSHARVPMSVLLHELATLPRLTHLRLPRQILRDENLEHLVAALAYTDLLPRLRGLDENVLQAMDRMEKSYTMQLDMVTFLLQKPSGSDHPPTRSGAQNL
ncbi:hypothetical protein P3T76_000999 [Phytophthora citrophthora]|uniref:F-box domain-containing protein n=1 Tax=Phytophthora citrophthora TaxID=4793 RepID=A0AAD9LUB6_9STRA|nr:hypothetical protein P3T76_000999 [Phytophthora citrophthora]